MDLSRIAIEPRLREGWEAVDMGVSMTRAWWWPLQLSWLVPSAIVFVISLLVFSENTWLAFLVTWWLNPLWDRFPLLLASRALFDEPLQVGSVWKEWIRLFKTDWFSWLTWRRFSPTRSMDMPVTVLEQLRGEARSRRLTVLHRNASGVAFALTCLCILFEALTLVAIWVCVLLFLPSEFFMEEVFTGFTQLFWLSKWSVLIWYIALAFVSPFYVTCGFALYINRRIELEGWDIEIRFRHLAERFEVAQPKKSFARRSTVILLPLCICLGAALFGNHTAAQDQTENVAVQESQSGQKAKQAIVEVLSGDDFKRTEVREGWRLKKSEKTAEESDSPSTFFKVLAWFADTFGPFFKFIFSILKVVPILIWVGLGLLIAFALYHFRDALTLVGRSRKNKEETAAPDVLFGLDVRKESLPDNIPVEVVRLWQEGKHREAIGLLYRATLSGLIHQFSFEFYDGYTEQECALLVEDKQPGQLSVYVQRLTRTWQHLAYAHRLPADAQITELCAEWPRFFDESKRRER